MHGHLPSRMPSETQYQYVDRVVRLAKSRTDRQVHDLVVRMLEYVPAHILTRIPYDITLADDMKTIGLYGISMAVDNWSGQGSFMGYAYTCARYQMIEYARNHGRLPRKLIERSKKKTLAIARLTLKNTRPPSDTMVAAAIGETEDEYRRREYYTELYNTTVSLQALICEETSDTEFDAATSPLDTAKSALDNVFVEAALGILPPPEREVLVEYYYNQKTFKDIARELGRSESRMYQLAQQGLQRIRKMCEDE